MKYTTFWCDTQKTSLFNAAYLLSCHFSMGFFSVHWKHIIVTDTLLYHRALLCDLQCQWGSSPPRNTGWIAWYNIKEYGANTEPGKAIQQHSHLTGLQRHFPAWNTGRLQKNLKTKLLFAVRCSFFRLCTLTRVNMRAQESQGIPPAHPFC